jgi:hypothetical protein
MRLTAGYAVDGPGNLTELTELTELPVSRPVATGDSGTSACALGTGSGPGRELEHNFPQGKEWPRFVGMVGWAFID